MTHTSNKYSSGPNFDLRRLPSPWRYVVALMVMAPIMWLAWHLGKNRPRPYWLEHYLIPFLGWCYIALAVRWLVLKIIRRRK